MPEEQSEFNTAYMRGGLPGLKELALAHCEEHPPDRRIVRRLLALGDHQEVRTRLASDLAEKKRHGVWAPIRVNGGQKIKKQRRVDVPFCEFEVSLKAWRLLLKDLTNPATRYKTLNCRTPADLTRALSRKIENTLKSVAKKQIHFAQFDPEDTLGDAHKPDNIIYFGRDGRASDDPHQLDKDIDAISYVEKTRRFLVRMKPQLLDALKRFLADEGHAAAANRDASYREQETLLNYLRAHRDEIMVEPLT